MIFEPVNKDYFSNQNYSSLGVSFYTYPLLIIENRDMNKLRHIVLYEDVVTTILSSVHEPDLMPNSH